MRRIAWAIFGLLLLLAGTVVVTQATRPATTHAATDDALREWRVGQTIKIPNPINPLITSRLTVLQATEWGSYAVVDGDGDVFTCEGNVSADFCQPAGMTCPPGAAWAARTPGIGNNALWMCKQTPTGRQAAPVGYVTIPTCQPGQRLWVTQAGNRIVGYECK